MNIHYKQTSIVFLFAIHVLFFANFTKSMDKETVYSAMEDLCLAKDEFDLLYHPYSDSKGFLWEDFYEERTSADNQAIVRLGQSFPLIYKSYRAYHRDWSMVEGMEFAHDYYQAPGYVPSVPTIDTYLNHPEGRDFLPYVDSCSFSRHCAYNWVHYNRENLNSFGVNEMGKTNLNIFSNEIISMSYQLMRGLLYLFQNNHHFVKLEKDRIFFKNVRGMNHYKIKDIYNAR